MANSYENKRAQAYLWAKGRASEKGKESPDPSEYLSSEEEYRLAGEIYNTPAPPKPKEESRGFWDSLFGDSDADLQTRKVNTELFRKYQAEEATKPSAPGTYHFGYNDSNSYSLENVAKGLVNGDIAVMNEQIFRKYYDPQSQTMKYENVPVAEFKQDGSVRPIRYDKSTWRVISETPGRVMEDGIFAQAKREIPQEEFEQRARTKDIAGGATGFGSGILNSLDPTETWASIANGISGNNTRTRTDMERYNVAPEAESYRTGEGYGEMVGDAGKMIGIAVATGGAGLSPYATGAIASGLTSAPKTIRDITTGEGTVVGNLSELGMNTGIGALSFGIGGKMNQTLGKQLAEGQIKKGLTTASKSFGTQLGLGGVQAGIQMAMDDPRHTGREQMLGIQHKDEGFFKRLMANSLPMIAATALTEFAMPFGGAAYRGVKTRYKMSYGNYTAKIIEKADAVAKEYGRPMTPEEIKAELYHAKDFVPTKDTRNIYEAKLKEYSGVTDVVNVYNNIIDKLDDGVAPDVVLKDLVDQKVYAAADDVANAKANIEDMQERMAALKEQDQINGTTSKLNAYYELQQDGSQKLKFRETQVELQDAIVDNTTPSNIIRPESVIKTIYGADGMQQYDAKSIGDITNYAMAKTQDADAATKEFFTQVMGIGPDGVPIDANKSTYKLLQLFADITGKSPKGHTAGDIVDAISMKLKGILDSKYQQTNPAKYIDEAATNPAASWFDKTVAYGDRKNLFNKIVDEMPPTPGPKEDAVLAMVNAERGKTKPKKGEPPLTDADLFAKATEGKTLKTILQTVGLDDTPIVNDIVATEATQNVNPEMPGFVHQNDEVANPVISPNPEEQGFIHQHIPVLEPGQVYIPDILKPEGATPVGQTSELPIQKNDGIISGGQIITERPSLFKNMATATKEETSPLQYDAYTETIRNPNLQSQEIYPEGFTEPAYPVIERGIKDDIKANAKQKVFNKQKIVHTQELKRNTQDETKATAKQQLFDKQERVRSQQHDMQNEQQSVPTTPDNTFVQGEANTIPKETQKNIKTTNAVNEEIPNKTQPINTDTEIENVPKEEQTPIAKKQTEMTAIDENVPNSTKNTVQETNVPESDLNAKTEESKIEDLTTDKSLQETLNKIKETNDIKDVSDIQNLELANKHVDELSPKVLEDIADNTHHYNEVDNTAEGLKQLDDAKAEIDNALQNIEPSQESPIQKEIEIGVTHTQLFSTTRAKNYLNRVPNPEARAQMLTEGSNYSEVASKYEGQNAPYDELNKAVFDDYVDYTMSRATKDVNITAKRIRDVAKEYNIPDDMVNSKLKELGITDRVSRLAKEDLNTSTTKAGKEVQTLNEDVTTGKVREEVDNILNDTESKIEDTTEDLENRKLINSKNAINQSKTISRVISDLTDELPEGLTNIKTKSKGIRLQVADTHAELNARDIIEDHLAEKGYTDKEIDSFFESNTVKELNGGKVLSINPKQITGKYQGQIAGADIKKLIKNKLVSGMIVGSAGEYLDQKEGDPKDRTTIGDMLKFTGATLMAYGLIKNVKNAGSVTKAIAPIITKTGKLIGAMPLVKRWENTVKPKLADSPLTKLNKEQYVKRATTPKERNERMSTVAELDRQEKLFKAGTVKKATTLVHIEGPLAKQVQSAYARANAERAIFVDNMKLKNENFKKAAAALDKKNPEQALANVIKTNTDIWELMNKVENNPAYSRAEKDALITRLGSDEFIKSKLKENGITDVDAGLAAYKLGREVQNYETQHYVRTVLMDMGIDPDNPQAYRDNVYQSVLSQKVEIQGLKTRLKEAQKQSKAYPDNKPFKQLVRTTGMELDLAKSNLKLGVERLKAMDNVMGFADRSANRHHVMNTWAYLKADNPFGFSSYEVGLSKNGSRFTRKNQVQSIENSMRLFKTAEERNAYVQEYMTTHDVKPVEGFNGIYEMTKDGKKAYIRINDNINFDVNNMYITQNIHKTRQMMLRLLRDETNVPKMKDQFLAEIKSLKEQLKGADADDALDFRIDDTINTLDEVETMLMGVNKQLNNKSFRGTKKTEFKKQIGDAIEGLDQVTQGFKESNMAIKEGRESSRAAQEMASRLENLSGTLDDKTAIVSNVKDVFKYILQPKSKPYFRNKGTHGWEPTNAIETIKMWDAGITDEAHHVANRYMSNKVRNVVEDQLIKANEVGYRGEYQEYLHNLLDDLNNSAPFSKQYLERFISPETLEKINSVETLATAGVLAGNLHAGVVNQVMGGLSYNTAMIGEGLNPLKVPKKGMMTGLKNALFNKENSLADDFNSKPFDNDMLNEFHNLVLKNRLPYSTSASSLNPTDFTLKGKNWKEKLFVVQDKTETMNRYITAMGYGKAMMDQHPFIEGGKQTKAQYLQDLMDNTTNFVYRTQGSFEFMNRTNLEKMLLKLPLGKSFLTLQAPAINQLVLYANTLKKAAFMPENRRKYVASILGTAVLIPLLGGIEGMPFVSELKKTLSLFDSGDPWDEKSDLLQQVENGLEHYANKMGFSKKSINFMNTTYRKGMLSAITGADMSFKSDVSGMLTPFLVTSVMQGMLSDAKTMRSTDETWKGVLEILNRHMPAAGRIVSAGVQLSKGDKLDNKFNPTGQKYGIGDALPETIMGKPVRDKIANERTISGTGLMDIPQNRHERLNKLNRFEGLTTGSAIKDRRLKQEGIITNDNLDNVIESQRNIINNENLADVNKRSQELGKKFMEDNEKILVRLAGKWKVDEVVDYQGRNLDIKRFRDMVNKYSENYYGKYALSKAMTENTGTQFSVKDDNINLGKVMSGGKKLSSYPLEERGYRYALYKIFTKGKELGYDDSEFDYE